MRKKILVGGMASFVGGLEIMLMNYCERMAKQGIQFDFVCKHATCSFQERIAAMGGQVFFLPKRSRHPIRYFRETKKFFKEHGHEYSALWENDSVFNNITVLRYAKRFGVKCRIVHSHASDNMNRSLLGKIRTGMHKWNRARMAGAP